MRKVVAAALLLLSLLSTNTWSLELCRESLSDIPDCCRNGFCPTHHHDNDCVCKLSPDNHALLILSVIGPAILSAYPNGPMMPASPLVDFQTFRATSFDRPTLTPPPKV
jgi:hypothetical protein